MSRVAFAIFLIFFLPNFLLGGTAKLSIYLSIDDPESSPLWFELKKIAISTDGKEWRAFKVDKEINSKEIGRGQFLIGLYSIPPGNYRFLKLEIGKAASAKGEKLFLLSKKKNEFIYTFPKNLSLDEGDSKCLFLRWNLRASLKGVFTFDPFIVPILQGIPLRGELLYVSCNDINTIYVADASENHIIASIGVDSPFGFAIRKEQDSMYIVSSSQRKIYTLELSTNRIINEFPIPGAVSPTFIVLSQDGSIGYVTDPYTDSVFKIDMFSGYVIAKKKVGVRPYYILYDYPSNTIFVSSTEDHSVYMVDPDDLSILGSIRVGDKPEGLLLYKNFICSTDRNSDSITVYDLSERNYYGKVNIGFEPRRIIAWNNKVFVSCYGSDEISIIILNHFIPFKTIKTKKGPLSMDIYPSRSWLYVAERESKSIGVVDLTTETYIYSIPLPGKPFELKVVY